MALAGCRRGGGKGAELGWAGMRDIGRAGCRSLAERQRGRSGGSREHARESASPRPTSSVITQQPPGPPRRPAPRRPCSRQTAPSRSTTPSCAAAPSSHLEPEVPEEAHLRPRVYQLEKHFGRRRRRNRRCWRRPERHEAPRETHAGDGTRAWARATGRRGVGRPRPSRHGIVLQRLFIPPPRGEIVRACPAERGRAVRIRFRPR
jgi:hypothetical protein